MIIHIERGDGRARRTYGTMTAGPKWEGGRPAGRYNEKADGDVKKYFLVVGDVRPYGGTYQGGTGGQAGDGENGKV